MVDRCIPQIYNPRLASEEVCRFDKALAALGLNRNCKLSTTLTEGGIFADYTVQLWFICYLP